MHRNSTYKYSCTGRSLPYAPPRSDRYRPRRQCDPTPRDYYICCAAFPSTDRVLAMVIPYSDISRVSRSLTFEMILVMIVLSGIAYALAMYLANHILRRVKQLADTMQDVENGNTNVLFSAPARTKSDS